MSDPVKDDEAAPEKKKRGRKPKVEPAPQAPPEEIEPPANENPEVEEQINTLYDGNDMMDEDDGSNCNNVNIYDKYLKLLESIITHEELSTLNEVPVFLIPPPEGSQLHNSYQ